MLSVIIQVGARKQLLIEFNTHCSRQLATCWLVNRSIINHIDPRVQRKRIVPSCISYNPNSHPSSSQPKRSAYATSALADTPPHTSPPSASDRGKDYSASSSCHTHGHRRHPKALLQACPNPERSNHPRSLRRRRRGKC